MRRIEYSYFFARRLRQRTVRQCLVAGLVLVCAAGVGVCYGQAAQHAASGKASEPAAQPRPPQWAIEFVNQGNSELDRKDFAAAEAAFQKAIQDAPTFAAAHRGLGIALWQQGKLDAAWTELSEVARLEANSARAHYELGELAWSIYTGPAGKAAAATGLSPDDFQAIALSEMAKAVSLDPHDFRMRLDLSELELDAGRKKEAQADALGAAGLASSASERSLAHLAVARAALATGDEMRAEAEFRKALAGNPASGSAYFGLGQICLVQQDLVQAEKYFHEAIEASPDLAPAYTALARLLVKDGQPVEAARMLKKAVALEPDDWQSQYELAKLMVQAGQSASARELFKKIITQQPDFLRAGEQLALMHLRQGDVKDAVAQAQALVARNPQAAEGHRVLALALWRQRRTEESLAECAQALAADPSSTSMLALQSLELWQTKHKRDARRVLREVARRKPEVLSALYFCRLIACGAADISTVGDFLRQNRYILSPPDSQ